MNVVQRLMEDVVEFVWCVGVGTVICMSNPTTVLRLCCVVVGVVTIFTRYFEDIKFLPGFLSCS